MASAPRFRHSWMTTPPIALPPLQGPSVIGNMRPAPLQRALLRPPWAEIASHGFLVIATGPAAHSLVLDSGAPGAGTEGIILASATAAMAQTQTERPDVVPGARSVTVERITVHGQHLEGNLEGNSADRTVLVYLPPSYQADAQRRFPVIYALHGYSIGAEQWTGEAHTPQTIEGAFATGAQEAIVVLPDSRTAHSGSMYSSSVTTGDFERFVARDVVKYIDETYRTIPQRRARGLVGHSMGGYGASRIGMKHADVFGSLYVMSPCCLSPRGAGLGSPEALPAAWPNGSVRGLRARGGFEVDITWRDGRLTEAVLVAERGEPVRVRVGNQVREYRPAPGERIVITS